MSEFRHANTMKYLSASMCGFTSHAHPNGVTADIACAICFYRSRWCGCRGGPYSFVACLSRIIIGEARGSRDRPICEQGQHEEAGATREEQNILSANQRHVIHYSGHCGALGRRCKPTPKSHRRSCQHANPTDCPPVISAHVPPRSGHETKHKAAVLTRFSSRSRTRPSSWPRARTDLSPGKETSWCGRYLEHGCPVVSRLPESMNDHFFRSS